MARCARAEAPARSISRAGRLRETHLKNPAEALKDGGASADFGRPAA
jgi:hypothetical protein